jgi:hypothetical protein
MNRIVCLALMLGLGILGSGHVSADDGFFVIAGGGKAGTQINSVPFTISTPGFYYLTRNLTSGSNGILVAAHNVTLDLMGYCLSGPGKDVGTNDGVRVIAGYTNAEIRNGTIEGFSYHGLTTESFDCLGVRAIGIRALNNGTGILLQGPASLAFGCSAINNKDYGIFFSTGASQVKNNLVFQNGNIGIGVFGGSTISGNTSTSNGGIGIVNGGVSNITYNVTEGLSNSPTDTVAYNTVF